MSDVVYSTETQACAVGIPGCSCDLMEDGTILRFCECHGCYTCGEIECGGHSDE